MKRIIQNGDFRSLTDNMNYWEEDLWKIITSKRYSFLVGPNEPNHTCRKQFVSRIIQENITVDAYNNRDTLNFYMISQYEPKGTTKW